MGLFTGALYHIITIITTNTLYVHSK